MNCGTKSGIANKTCKEQGSSGIQVGDVVRFKPGIRTGEIPDGREANETAVVSVLLTDIPRGIKTEKDLMGIKYWNVDDLEKVPQED